jgi:putative transposon-encoded protein
MVSSFPSCDKISYSPSFFMNIAKLLFLDSFIVNPKYALSFPKSTKMSFPRYTKLSFPRYTKLSFPKSFIGNPVFFVIPKCINWESILFNPFDSRNYSNDKKRRSFVAYVPQDDGCGSFPKYTKLSFPKSFIGNPVFLNV